VPITDNQYSDIVDNAHRMYRNFHRNRGGITTTDIRKEDSIEWWVILSTLGYSPPTTEEET
jgi:hypothetical protein